MRVSIVIDDNMVAVGGVGYRVDCGFIDREIHAIQWYDTHGEIEFRSRFLADEKRWDRRPNEHFEEFAPYERVLEEWHLRKQDADEAVRIKLAADEEFERIRTEQDERNKLLNDFLRLAREAQANGLPPPEMPKALAPPEPNQS